MSEKDPFHDEKPERNDPLMGTIEAGGFISETPPDIDEFLTEIGFRGQAYVCTVKRAPKEGSGAKEFLPVNVKGTYPSINDLGKRFGPGQYFYCFSWITKDPDTGKSKKIFKEYKVYLGSEWEDIYDEYQAEIWAKKEKKIIQTAQQKKLRDAARGIAPGEVDREQKDPFDEFEKMATKMKNLGVPLFNANNNAPAPADNSNQLLMFMMKMQSEAQDRSDKMTMFMMKMMMQQNGGGDSTQMFDKVFDLFKGVVNVKELLNPEKQTVVDKVFNLAESVLPAIMEIAKKPPAQRQADPLVGVVKNSADFNKMKDDPEMLKAAIKKWDDAHGPEQTNVILETIGLKRPGMESPPEPSGEDESDNEGEFTDIEPDEVHENAVDDSGNIEPDENPME